MAATVGIDHQQMDRVATYVQDAQSHEAQPSRATMRDASRPADEPDN
jgi:hypothetical protein